MSNTPPGLFSFYRPQGSSAWSWFPTSVHKRTHDPPLLNISDLVIGEKKLPKGEWEFVFAIDALLPHKLLSTL